MPTEQIEDDLETMRHGFNLCVGQLRADELEAFNRLCRAGYARRIYRGAMGFLGLAMAERDYPPNQEEL